MQRWPLVACLLMSFGTAGAHPHSYVDQQALVSVGSNSVDVTIRIVPSFDNGAAIFAGIDADGNGVVSQGEAAEFAATVIAKARLEVDASTRFTLSNVGEHQVAFEIAYYDFSHDWQVQPFFYTDFAATMTLPTMARSDAGNQVGILFFSRSPP